MDNDFKMYLEEAEDSVSDLFYQAQSEMDDKSNPEERRALAGRLYEELGYAVDSLRRVLLILE